MLKYDNFEVFMINKLNYWSKRMNSEDNKLSVEVFSELISSLYEYEKAKDNGDIMTD